MLRFFSALRGWIHGSNNEDLSKRPCLFFANKTLPRADTCWPKRSKPKKIFFSKKFSDFNQNRLRDQKFFTDLGNGEGGHLVQLGKAPADNAQFTNVSLYLLTLKPAG
jgi:hypothetical protein